MVKKICKKSAYFLLLLVILMSMAVSCEQKGGLMSHRQKNLYLIQRLEVICQRMRRNLQR